MSTTTLMKQNFNRKTSIAVSQDVHRLIGNHGPAGTPLECVILRALTVIDSDDRLRKSVVEYDGYRTMKDELNRRQAERK